MERHKKAEEDMSKDKSLREPVIKYLPYGIKNAKFLSASSYRYHSKYKDEARKHVENLAGIALDDLGYENTKEARDWLIKSGFIEDD